MPTRVITLTNHLMPPFQLAFPLSWGYKNWLLAQEKHQILLELAHCSNIIQLALPGGAGQPAVPAAPTLSLLFVLNKLTPFWNTLSGNSFPTHAQADVTPDYIIVDCGGIRIKSQMGPIRRSPLCQIQHSVLTINILQCPLFIPCIWTVPDQ